jgi:fatty-acyl-CoA synthase
MNLHPIAAREDIARIEARPYAEFMPYRRVPEALEAASARSGGRPALVYLESADPGAPVRTWTHGEFIAVVRRTARLFSALAAGEVPRVALLLPPMPQAYFALWGAEAAGVVCPINFLLKAEHIAELVRAAQATIVVALGPHPDLDIWSHAEQLPALCPGLRHLLAVGGAPGAESFDERLAETPDGAWPLVPSATPGGAGDETVALFHTGGTTGAPKLAIHTHANQLHAAWGAANMYGTTERDVMLNGFPLFHVAGAFVYGLSTLLAGGCVVLPTLLGLRNAAFVKRYWEHVERHRVTLLGAVPTVIAALLNVERGGVSLASVRALLTGGSPLPGELAAQFEQTFGVPVRNILGMTECAGVISIEPPRAPRTPGSCGLPLPFTEVVALAADGSACAAGESGVLRVRGPNVGPGYTDARRNAGTFSADGWLITGDIGHVDDQGRVFVTGRAKDVIIRSSHNIDPGLIEEALLAHPEVQMAAAVGEPDEYAGELPIAYVQLKPGATASAAALLQFACERIAERPAYPKRVELVDSIPLTAIGKVYKPALRLRAIEHAVVERLAAAGLGGRFGVQGVDEGAQLIVAFEPRGGNATAEDQIEIRRLMAPFAIPFRIGGG